MSNQNFKVKNNLQVLGEGTSTIAGSLTVTGSIAASGAMQGTTITATSSFTINNGLADGGEVQWLSQGNGSHIIDNIFGTLRFMASGVAGSVHTTVTNAGVWGFSNTINANISGNAATATRAYGASFTTAANTGIGVENLIGASCAGYDAVYIYNNSTGWGLYSAAGGMPLSFSRSTGIFSHYGVFTTQSDARLKSNISTLSGSLARVCAMRGVEYDRNGTHEIGVIAQEMQVIRPEVISIIPERDPDAPIKDVLSVNYSSLVAELIEAIKEQQAIINNLQTRLTNAGL